MHIFTWNTLKSMRDWLGNAFTLCKISLIKLLSMSKKYMSYYSDWSIGNFDWNEFEIFHKLEIQNLHCIQICFGRIEYINYYISKLYFQQRKYLVCPLKHFKSNNNKKAAFKVPKILRHSVLNSPVNIVERMLYLSLSHETTNDGKRQPVTGVRIENTVNVTKNENKQYEHFRKMGKPIIINSDIEYMLNTIVTSMNSRFICSPYTCIQWVY